jgi:glycosyltransferase involved in cell wall biosynthesis
MNGLTIIIPSRKQEKQITFIQRAVESVRSQTIQNQFAITFLVAVDKSCALDNAVLKRLGIACVESDGATQAKALNAAIREVKEGFVAFLEDDDQWMPNYLSVAMSAINHCDFISSTQLEFDQNDNFLRILDFPTPSGWFMPLSTLRKVGEFNEGYRFHLDNEWLGRLLESKLKRIHLVESTAPVNKKYVEERFWLKNLLILSNGLCRLGRHESPYPLVKRLVHTNSGMALIATNPDYLKISRVEYENLRNRFGFIPC